MNEDIAHWPSGTVRIVWHGPGEPELPLTGAHGFCFYQGTILVCDISGRGLTIPGVGLANLRLLGFVEADHRANSEFDGRYPLRSIQAIYRADVAEVREFDSGHESTDRRFVPISELREVHHEWNTVLQKALNVAVKMEGL
jgi:hypothetical protein